MGASDPRPWLVLGCCFALLQKGAAELCPVSLEIISSEFQTNRLVASADGHNTTGQVIPADYGDGPVEVSIAGFATELDSKVIESAKELGGRFAFNQDFNSGNNVGVGK